MYLNIIQIFNCCSQGTCASEKKKKKLNFAHNKYLLEKKRNDRKESYQKK